MLARTKAKVSLQSLEEPQERTKKRKKTESENPNEETKGEEVAVRQLNIVFAPHLPSSNCKYFIDRSGMRGIQ